MSVGRKAALKTHAVQTLDCRKAFGLRWLQHRFSKNNQGVFILSKRHSPGIVFSMNSDPQPPTPEPASPSTFKLPSVHLVDLKSQLPPKDWPHAPIHRLAENAVYFVTASTLNKQHLFDTPVKRGLLEVEWPGRMQVLPGRPAVVLDVAHNPHAARALAEALGSMGFFQNTYAVFGMLKDKDIDAVIDLVKHRIDFWFIAGLENVAGVRGATVELLAEKLSVHRLQDKFSRHASITSAYAAARERAGQNDRILVFGSFSTVGEILGIARSH